MQRSSQIITTNKPTPSFLQAGRPSCRPTNSVKALKGKVSHSMDLLTPSSPGGLPSLSLTTNSPWLPLWSVAMPLISPLMPVLPQTQQTLNIFPLFVAFCKLCPPLQQQGHKHGTGQKTDRTWCTHCLQYPVWVIGCILSSWER